MDTISHAGSKGRHPFKFSGQGFEYFKIWIVNLCLTVLTLGVYSAWAKVRTNRYFYANTHFAGSVFEYLANPVQILQGRLIAVAAFVLYSAVSEIMPLLGLGLFVILILLLPWIVVQALSFRAHNSAYRNIRFSFNKDYKQAIKVYILYPILVIITLGLLFAWWKQRMSRFTIENSRYGTSYFNFNSDYASGLSFFVIYFKSGLLAIGMLLLFGLLAALISAIGWSPENITVLMTAGTMIGYFLVYMVVFAYVSARLNNLIFSNIALGPAADYRLCSYMRFSGVLAIYMTNTLGIICTVGLYIPWAKIRMARYKASKLCMVAVNDLDVFVASEQERTGTIGEEMGEVFDIDIGI